MSSTMGGPCQFCQHMTIRENLFGGTLHAKHPDARKMVLTVMPGFNGKPTCDVCYGIISAKLTKMYEEWCGQELKRMSFHLVRDSSVLPNTIEFKTDGKVVGKITNIGEDK